MRYSEIRRLNESKYDRYRDNLITTPYENDEDDNIEKFNKIDAWDWFKLIDWRKFKIFDSNIDFAMLKHKKIKPEYVRQGKAYFKWNDGISGHEYLCVMTKDDENDLIEFILGVKNPDLNEYVGTYKYIMREDGSFGKWFKCKEREFMIATKKYKSRDRDRMRESINERVVIDDIEEIRFKVKKDHLDIGLDINNFCYNRKGDNLEVIYYDGRNKEVDYADKWLYFEVLQDSKVIFKYDAYTCKAEISIGSIARMIEKLISEYIMTESFNKRIKSQLNEGALTVDRFSYGGSGDNKPFPDGSAKGDMSGHNKAFSVYVNYSGDFSIQGEYCVVVQYFDDDDHYDAIAEKYFKKGKDAIKFAEKLIKETDDPLYDLKKVASKYGMMYQD